MTNTDIYPYGQNQPVPTGYPIANDLNTNDAQQALSAAMGYKLARTHWNGKKWWGFGTSITDVGAGTGKYAPYLAALSGMTFVDHGHGGKGITTAAAGQDVYNDIMAVTSSCDADLITLEIGANDHAAPLGTPYDGLPDSTVTNNSTLCGALNICIRHLQEVTNAQIVVIGSPKGRRSAGSNPTIRYGNEKWGSDNHTFLERDEAIRQVCAINSVYYLPPADGMGYARMNASNDYNVDQIHQTNLGGYNFAQAIWSQLKNIPLFYTALPT